ncbi:MAG: YitT family protein, partial [Oscillospiraceae bacterium]
ITLFVSSKAIDAAVYGLSTGKLVYIITQKPNEITNQVISKLQRSATLINTHGAYTNEEQVMIMCAVRQSEYVKVKKMVMAIDPKAFIIITTSNEVVGLGWQSE